MQNLPNLSKAEYDILRILWKGGRKTVREVHDELQETTGWAYTTTKTMMDRMAAKELLTRDSFHGIFLYSPLVSRPAGLAKMVQFFADRVLETDASTVVSMFAGGTLSDEEIKELNELLSRDAEKEDGK